VRLTWHLAPAESWTDGAEGYVPRAFADEGFIHCTTGTAALAATGDRYYRDDPRPYVALAIDLDHVRARVEVTGPGGIYPHIHGALNRDAIMAVVPLARREDGTFVPPEPPSRD